VAGDYSGLVNILIFNFLANDLISWYIYSLVTCSVDIFFFLTIIGRYSREIKYYHSIGMYKLKEYFDFLYHKLYFDTIINETMSIKVFKKGNLYHLFIEKGFLEFFGPDGIVVTGY
jgi:hypothetical protein